MGPLPAGTGTGAEIHHAAGFDQDADAGGDVGQRSPYPQELSDLIAARIAGAKLVVMPAAGHIPFMEQPEEVVRIVLQFLEELDG